MLVTKNEVKRTSKKLLSVLLALVMMMTSMSVCFGVSAASASASATQWNTLLEALKSVTYPVTVTGTANNYVINDPDGTVIDAVNAYWDVFTTIANTNPAASANPSTGTSDSSTIRSNEGNLTVNQANASIISHLSGMSGYTTSMGTFLEKLTSGVTVPAKGADQVQGPDESNNTTKKTSNLADTTVKFTVKADSLLTERTLDDLPDNIALSKEYYVYHKGDRYDYVFDYTAEKKDSCGNVTAKATYKHTYTYFSRISGWEIKDGAPVNTQVIKDTASTLSSYADYFTADLETLVSKGNSNLSSVKSIVNTAKSNVVTTFSLSVFNHFFPTYDVDALNTNIDNAIIVNNYIGIARDIINLTAEDFTGYSYDQLNTLYNTLQTKINNYKPNNATADAYIVAQTGLDLAASNARLTAINKEMQLIKIREAKVVIDGHMATFNAYTTEQIDEGTLTSGMIGAAITTINGDKTKLNSYTRAYVDEVCGSDYYSQLNNCTAYLNELATAANYNDQFSAKYAEFVADIQKATDITLSDADLLAGLQSYDTWLTEFKALINQMKSVLGEDLANALFDELHEPAIAHMEAGYDALRTKVETQVNDAYALFTAFLAAYPDGAVDFKNVSQFTAMKYSIGLINVDAYNYLPTAQNGVSFSAETVRKYNELQRTFPDFDAFVESMGFSEFETVNIEDIVRPDTLEDIARENENGEYVVDDAKVLEIISKLEALLQNPAIKELLGKLINKDKETGEWTGEAFDIASMLNDLIKGALFTDSFINTVIGMLYPLVVTEFIKVWANELPPSFHLDEIVILDLGILGKIRVPGQDANISYDKNLYTVLKESPMNIFPDLLAGVLDSAKYADNIALLKQASSQFKTEFGATDNNYYTIKIDGDGKKVADKTPWDAAILKKDQLDENGNPVIDPETGKVVKTSEWALTWGVDDAKTKVEAGEMTEAEFEEFFYQAFDDAVEGLKPLLLALIANKDWTNNDVTDMASLVIKDISVIGDTNVTVDLDLSATANRGYANLLVPVYEALGLKSNEFTAPGTLEGYATNSNAAADILKAILTPIFTFVGKLGANPLNTLLGILPDICYVLMTQSVPKLLDMLKTTITYFGKPIGTGIPFIGELDLTTVSDAAKVEGGADISVGSMLDLKDMGVDLTDGLNSVLPMLGISLPQLDQGKIATLGTLTTISTQRAECIYTAPAAGKAYHIEANKADVLLYILDWALGNLNTILSSFGLDLGSAGELLTAIGENPDLAIAAIAELLTMEEYDTLRKFEWFNGVISGENVLGNSAANIYLNPNNDWTEAKADYLYKNIDAIVGAILTMAGLDLDKETEGVQADLGEFIGGAIDGLLSDKTLTALAGLLAKLDLNALLAPKDEEAEGEGADAPETVSEGEETEAPALDVNALVNSLLGIDLSVFAEKYADIAAKLEADETYVHNFGVDAGDKTFAEVLATMLEPLSAVLDFILKGTDLVIENGDKDIVLPGYDGYNNAIIPLLEALGCNVVASADLGETSELEATLTALLSKIDAIVNGDTVKGIIDILPGVLYFIASKGLSVTVRNLLQPVYVILDTIRPIYDVNLAELINGLLPDDFGMTINFDDIGIEFIFDLLENLLLKEVDLGTLLDDLKALIYDVCDITATEYDSASDFQTNWKKGAYILEGDNKFTQADLLTVLLSFVLDWASDAENAAKLDELLKTNGLIASIVSILDTDVEITYDDPDWMYWFKGDEEAFEEYLDNPSRINTLATLDWDNITDNDWDLETAQYFADNIDELVDLIIGMINKDKEDAPKTLAALLNGLVNDNLGEYFTDETINTLIGYISGVLANVDDVLLDIGYALLNVDLTGLKNYKCEKEITTLDGFLAELGYVLDTYAQGLLGLLFFGDDIRLAKKPGTNGPVDTIVINGGFGYEKGLAIILEALGCDVPVADKATATNVLKSLADRVDGILANPVDEILDLLPNLVYALNANAAGVAVNNLLQPVNALLDKINGLGLLEKEININELLTVEIGGEKVAILENLQLANIVEIVEGATGLPLDAAADILVNFCTGKISEGKFGYKMAAAREDVITILLYVALELVSDEDFAKALDEMLGTDFIAQIKSVFEPSTIEYDTPDWNYAAADNGTVDAMKYSITYPNNWTEETAQYVTELLLSDEFDALISGLIEDGKYASISELLKDKVNVFTTENLQAIIDLVAGLLGDIDENLLKVGYELLDVDLVGLKNHKVAEVNNVEEFAAELANILGYAKGAVEWLLLGRDFKLLVKDDDGIGAGLEGDAYITISGAQGYANGLALLLEALGVAAPAVIKDAEGNIDTAKTVEAVLVALADRIEVILGNPVVEIINLLPNLFYFLNTNGVAAVIKNTTAAVMALVDKLSGFGVKLDLNELVNLKKLMKIEDTDAAISLDNLSMEDIIVALGYMVGLNLNEVKKVLVGFDLGAIAEYESVSDANAVGTAKKMSYYGDKDSEESFLEHDMVTIIANLALITLADEANADFLKGLVGEEIYDVIVNILNIDTLVPDVKNMNWQYVSEETGGNKVGESITAIETSDLFKNFTYGPNFTKEMADYIATNFGTFVDNIIYLLGIEMDGETYESLSEILKELVGENVYNSANVVAIQNALAGFLGDIANLEVNGVAVGGYIVEVLKTSLDVDISAVSEVVVPEFTKDKDQFVKYLAEVLNPLGAVLKWLLTDEDIAFFVNEGKTDLIKLPGAEGYKTGLVLLLEALGCEDIVAPEALENMTGAEMVIAIIDPLLNKVNNILDDPAEELLAVLPNLIYFINSNGVDVVVKNTLNAVCTLLEAISPVADIDLDSLIYDLVGLSLDKITTEHLIDMLLKDFEIAGFKFTGIEVNDIVGELSVGVLEEYPSLSHEDPAYRMVYDKDSGSADEGDMVTVLLRFIIKFISTDNNKAVLVDLLKSLGMGAEAEKYVTSLFELLVTCIADTKLGMDTALYTIYYIYYGVDLGAEEIATGKRDLNAAWQKKLAELSKDATSEETDVSDLITDIFDIMFNPEGEVPEEGGNDVLDKDGLASNGFLAFFARIKAFFQEIADFFRNLFSFGK